VFSFSIISARDNKSLPYQATTTTAIKRGLSPGVFLRASLSVGYHLRTPMAIGATVIEENQRQKMPVLKENQRQKMTVPQGKPTAKDINVMCSGVIIDSRGDQSTTSTLTPL
jgi:hypothetical protein